MVVSHDQQMQCRCGLEAALKVSSSGRKYLGCQRKPASNQCDFTRMLPDNTQEGASPTLSQDLTKTRSQNEIIDPIFAHLPPTATQGPMKRTPPVEIDDDPQLLPSQKRARIIEAVLKGSVQDPSASQRHTTPIQEALHRSNGRPPNGAPPTGLLDPIPALPSDSSGATTPETTSQEVRAEAIMRVNGSSQSIGSSSGEMDPIFLDGVPSSRAVNTDTSWLLHTPKRTEFERSASMAAVLRLPEPSPVKTSKGKHRANEEWYKEKVAVVPSEESPSKRRYTAASVTHLLGGLSGLPNYLRIVEKDQEIKDMKINHLENEVQRLKNKQEELEKMLQMYEQHSSMIEHDS